VCLTRCGSASASFWRRSASSRLASRSHACSCAEWSCPSSFAGAPGALSAPDATDPSVTVCLTLHRRSASGAWDSNRRTGGGGLHGELLLLLERSLRLLRALLQVPALRDGTLQGRLQPRQLRCISFPVSHDIQKCELRSSGRRSGVPVQHQRNHCCE